MLYFFFNQYWSCPKAVFDFQLKQNRITSLFYHFKQQLQFSSISRNVKHEDNLKTMYLQKVATDCS